MKRRLIIAIVLTLISKWSSGQSGVADSSIHFLFLGVNYGYYASAGDLESRFGNASKLGLDLNFKTKKNWVFGLAGGFIFGDNVNENGLLNGISTSNNQIIGLDGLYADVRVFERGYNITATFGKIFRLKKPNPNSGFLLSVSPGFIQHKIRIETIGNTVPQLRNDYLKGYDHLTNGFQLSEFIGYVYFSNRQLLNVYAGLEFIQGFTSNRRDYNFDDLTKDDSNRLDQLYGFKIGWILPLYKKKPDAFYIY